MKSKRNRKTRGRGAGHFSSEREFSRAGSNNLRHWASKMLGREAPEPNIKGDYSGSCIACLRGCDTALAAIGEPNWHIAVFYALGLPFWQGYAITCYGWDEKPASELERHYRVCEECAGRARLQVGLVVEGGELPAVVQRKTFE